MPGVFVMSMKETRKEIYRRCREHCGLEDYEWARLMHLGESGGMREVHKKERPSDMQSSRGVSMPEALAAQLLAFLHDEGYDLLSVEFDADGKLVVIPRRTTDPSTH
jgi:hypothetical protein